MDPGGFTGHPARGYGSEGWPRPCSRAHGSHHDRMNDNAAIGWIREIVMNCADPWALARFWAELLVGIPVEWYAGWVTIEPPPHGQRLSFQASTAPRASGTALVHFDVLVEDLASAHDRPDRCSRRQQWNPRRQRLPEAARATRPLGIEHREEGVEASKRVLRPSARSGCVEIAFVMAV